MASTSNAAIISFMPNTPGVATAANAKIACAAGG